MDEVDRSSRRSGENILCLPSCLPEQVFFIVSSRARITIPLNVASVQEFNLSEFPHETLRDIERYIRKKAQRPAIRRWLRSKRISEQSLVEEVARKSEYNFMYVFYVLYDVESGKYGDVSLVGLPVGLQNYYQMHWERMGMMREPLDRNRLRLIYTLSRVRLPVSCALLSEFTEIDQLAVQQAVDEWSQFLHRQVVDEQARFSIYHSSFAEFLERTDIIQAAGVSLTGIDEKIAEQLLKDIHGSDRS